MQVLNFFIFLAIVARVGGSPNWQINFNNYDSSCTKPTEATATEDRSSQYGPFVRSKTIHGKAITGPNHRCGEKVIDGAKYHPALAVFGSPFLGLHDPNPDATNAIPLTPEMCADPATLDRNLASYGDPLFILGQGMTVDDRLLNRPILGAATTVKSDGQQSTVARPTPGLSPITPHTVLARQGEVTLRQWLSVKGTFEIKCRASATTDGVMATIYGSFENLIPNELYDMWGVFADFATLTLHPTSLGGVPAVFLSDESGQGEFFRTLHYCPLDFLDLNAALTQPVLLDFTAALHADGLTHGWVPGVTSTKTVCDGGACFDSATYGGTNIFDHLLFTFDQHWSGSLPATP
eukprot:TRINITY_DN113352_c0_g1_i1.p1 TRINITY_DN113352_c0_g1~~TRINITY_DN113352_c0_g1_i1.p1  ORF type:complete len:350 (-),score=37.47 TRINITY_DN113352_c0_g1_i1:27-1076(-)